MKKTIINIFVAGILLGAVCLPVLAEDATNPTKEQLMQQLQSQVEQLKTQIQALQTQLDAVRQAKQEIKDTAGEIKETLQLMRQLQYGMTGEDVKLLQEILATDPDVYPEGLITGYYGNLTRNAVKRFQKIAGLDQAGQVGPKTTAKINELLTEGAGNSGKVPPGLLIAPGIRKKLGFIPTPPADQELPPGISKKLQEEDKTAPVISEITATEIGATSIKITWTTNENADSKVWYGTTTPLVAASPTTSVSSAGLVLSHAVTLTGLTPSTTYYYVVSSTDWAANNTKGAEKSFATISKELSCTNSGGTVTTTSCCLSASDFPSSCVVGACGCAPADSHDVKTCNCGAGKCFDGNKCVAQDQTAPTISSITVTEIGATSAKVTWTTNENADSKVWYGTTTPLVTASPTTSISSADLVLSHSVTLTGLTVSTTYYYVVSSTDSAGNNTKGVEKSFATLSAQ